MFSLGFQPAASQTAPLGDFFPGVEAGAEPALAERCYRCQPSTHRVSRNALDPATFRPNITLRYPQTAHKRGPPCSHEADEDAARARSEVLALHTKACGIRGSSSKGQMRVVSIAPVILSAELLAVGLTGRARCRPGQNSSMQRGANSPPQNPAVSQKPFNS
jgi:hypothetical protein